MMGYRTELDAEISRTDCFLCAPNEQFVFHREGECYAMTGIGPIVPGYSVVATQTHAHSLSQLKSHALSEYLQYTTKIRNALSAEYGSCLLTEHGKMPICRSAVSTDSHCFHPHFLLFPNSPDVVERATSQIKDYVLTDNFYDAIEIGCRADQYLLVSPSEGHYIIFMPESLPNQYARLLVAEGVGNIELASWRDYPNTDMALEYRNKHKKLFG